jgi:hypothetical protein
MEEDKPQTHTPQEILNADTIQNLDTARMALRWALERMHKLEQEKAFFADKTAESERAKNKALEEYAALQKTISLRGAEANQRELYYAKMEEFLSLQLGGKLDLPALAKRELETKSLHELLQQKEQQLDKELSTKRASMERDFQRLRTELEAGARAKAKQAEQALGLKSSSLEQEYLSHMAEAHEKEILLKQETQALAERQAHFEEYYSTQRADLQSQIKNFRNDVDDQVDFRLQMAEKILTERYSGIEAGWNQEKALLSKELDSWRRRAQELGPKVLAMEQAVAVAEESGQQARSAADRNVMILEEHRRSSQVELAALQADAATWKGKAAHHLSEILDLKQRVAIAEEARKAAEAETSSVAAESSEWKQRFEAARAKTQEEARGKAALEEALSQARRSCELQEGMLEERRLRWDEEKKALRLEMNSWKGRLEADHTEDAKSWLEERSRLQAELAAGRTRAQESLGRLLELEKGLSGAEESENVLERHLSRFEQQKTAWETERGQLLVEIQQYRDEAAKTLPKILDLERRLTVATESILLVRAASERHDARFAEQTKTWDDERADLLARLESLKPKPVPPARLNP